MALCTAAEGFIQINPIRLQLSCLDDAEYDNIGKKCTSSHVALGYRILEPSAIHTVATWLHTN